MMQVSISLLLIVILNILCRTTKSAHILGLFMGNGHSHYVLGNSLMQALVQAGHEGVLISQYSNQMFDGPKYKEIAIQNKHTDIFYKSMKEINHNPFYVIDRTYKESKEIIPDVFENPEVKRLLNTSFDAVIVEQIFTDALKVFAWHFKAPLIVFHPFRADIWINPFVGNPTLPSFVPQYPKVFRKHMSFLERLENFGLYLYQTIFREFVYLKEHDKILRKYFPSSPELADIVYNTSLVLLNSDISVALPTPRVPNMIDVGGFHIIPTKVTLPTKVTIFLNSSKNGVIFVNLDILTSNYVSEEQRKLFINVFASLDYDILWIWDEETVPEQPSNVLIHDNTLSQTDVLAHHKINLFINLGDMLSIIDGVKYGVPQIFIPVLDEQLYNAAEAQLNDYADTIPFAMLTENKLNSTIRQMLNSSKYYNESQRRSKIFKEKPITPRQAVIFWVEYVLKTKGAEQMRVGSLDYPWHQLFMLDLLGFVTASIVLIVVVLVIIMRLIFRRCCCRKKNKSRLMRAKLSRQI